MLEFSIAPGTATQYKASLKILLQAASSASFDPLHMSELFSKATGRPASHLLSAYSLRRGGATTYYNKGVAPVRLQHLLRHVHFNTTAKYVDVQSHRSSRRATTAAVLR